MKHPLKCLGSNPHNVIRGGPWRATQHKLLVNEKLGPSERKRLERAGKVVEKERRVEDPHAHGFVDIREG